MFLLLFLFALSFIPMSRETAEKLISAKSESAREKIILGIPREKDLEVARKLKHICYEVWTSAPTKAQKAALVLEKLAQINPHKEISALAFWAAGIAELIKGKLENATEKLDKSAALFRQIKKEHEAAQTQVAKLIALALLGKYAEAVKTGKAALKVFEKYGDDLAAGKIEKNLGNVVARQGKEKEAEKFYLSARTRFVRIGNQTELAMNDNSLANTYAELNDFRKAETFYLQALEVARREKMYVTEAEIEASLGNLALFRGRYDEALRYLEVSRQKYEKLKMPHQTAIAELEIADMYLELNLIDEATAIYGKVCEKLRKLKLQGEEAHARANFAKTALNRNDFRKAKAELEKASQLFQIEKNPNGLANVKLTEANLEISFQNYGKALKIIKQAEKILAKSENRRQKLAVKWMRGEILRLLGKESEAKKMLLEAYTEAQQNEQSNLAQICLNSLGSLVFEKDKQKARKYFQKAVRIIEKLRAPLPAEEFRMAFLADKLAPYQNLAKIYIAENKLENAFLIVEKSRARTLSESLGEMENPDENSNRKLALHREELNWFYSRLKRAETGQFEKLQKEIARRERQIADLMRQINSAKAGKLTFRRSLSETESVKPLQKLLDKQKALIEFVRFGDTISAFVLTDRKIKYLANLTGEKEIIQLLEGLQFQFGALRYRERNLGGFISELKKRTDFYLSAIYEKLIRPLENFIEERSLIVVPAGALHYVPFHALKCGKYLLESREVTCAPSAAVWQFLQQEPPKKAKSALLVGVADEKIPLVKYEIKTLGKIFRCTKTLMDADANFSNFIENAPAFDILHLACHGQFRPDNPLFSGLHLADGFVTVRDICRQRLNAEVVTLSACETGLSKIFAGDEILGLSRGFLSAGAKSLILSLWTVNDAATSDLMKEFYINLSHGKSASEALRLAQLKFIKNNEHPYFWSPFILIGR